MLGGAWAASTGASAKLWIKTNPRSNADPKPHRFFNITMYFRKQISNHDRRFGFFLFCTFFYANDCVFILLSGTYGLYLADYYFRCFVLWLCFNWSVSSAMLEEKVLLSSPPKMPVLVLTIMALSGVAGGKLIECFQGSTDFLAFFRFSYLDNIVLRSFDLTAGLFLVAMSEEIIFRKFALIVLRFHFSRNIHAILVSAIIFSFAHWGGGVWQVALTFLYGLLAMHAYLKIGRLWPLVLAHWLCNFLVFSTP